MKTRKHSRWTYMKHALIHPWHVVVFAGSVVFGVANWSLLVLGLVFLGAELLLLGIICNTKMFHNYVDERMLEDARRAAREWRSVVLLKVRDTHRREFLRLETLISDMETRFEMFPEVIAYISHECKELLAHYLKLGIQYNLYVEKYVADIDDLKAHLRNLKKLQETRPDPLNEQRILIAEKRLEVLLASVEARANILVQMETIGEMISLKTEQAILPNQNPILKLRVSDADTETGELACLEDIDIEKMGLGRLT